MRKIILVLFLSFTFQSAYSQVWVDNGATWHFDFWQPLWPGYTEINYDRDTLIDAVSCQVFESTLYQFYDGEPAPSPNIPIQITYVSGDTVFYRDHEEFFVLFNFGAEIGDSWVISTTPFELFEDCADTSEIIVVDKGEMDIAGETYRYIDLEPTANSPFGFVGRYVERFGLVTTGLTNFRSLFPVPYACAGISDYFPAEFVYTGFLCFEDDSFSLYSPTSNSCTKVVSVPENSELVAVTCYPNPATNFLEISADYPIDNLQVYSAVGEYVTTIDISQHAAQLDVSTFARGVYFFDIRLENGLIVKRKIVLN